MANSQSTDASIFSVRIVSIDYYMSPPIPAIDICYSSFQGGKVNEVPVIRVYGSTPAGQKTCLHIHRAFPYLYVPSSDIPLNGQQEGDAYTNAILLALEKALKLKGNVGSKRQHVHGCSVVRAKKFYGYHSEEELFVKTYLYYPHDVSRAANMLLEQCLIKEYSLMNLIFHLFCSFWSLSRQDLQILVGYGCPTVDKKVVFSSKLLRKHVHLDEGDVCSNCSLRSLCERGYLLTNKEDEARTIDVMRVLLAYGFDSINGSVVNKSLLKQKSVKNIVRKLLHEVVRLSAVPIDPNLPAPVIKKPPPKVKQPPPPPKRRVGCDDVEMKKGDWLCPKCDFMNFAKNTVCLQCDAKRPKRQLLPGEWEWPECNFLNYRRNMACFHCDCKRPPDAFVENKMEERQQNSRRTLEKIPSRPEFSNAWNFDFDDNESDGVDVAAFEYADPAAMGEDSPLGSQAQEGNFRGHEDDLIGARRNSRVHETEYSDPNHDGYGRGFDDFDDEDDIDSYELDTQNNKPAWKASQNNISERGISCSEDDNSDTQLRTTPPSHTKPSKPKHQRAGFSGSEEDELDTGSDEKFSASEMDIQSCS